MTAYKNFIQDFPKGCGIILEEYRKDACKNGLEVTHMFAIASAAITIPFERLRDKTRPSEDKFRENYKKAVSQFDNLCGYSFLKSCLLNNDVRSWKMDEVDKANLRQDPEQWANNPSILQKDIKVKKVLNIIRNALAHGNIFTLPDDKDQIKHIIFLSEIRNGSKKLDVPFFNVRISLFGDYRKARKSIEKYNMLMVHTDDFCDFLNKWINFLKELEIPSEIKDVS